MGIRNKREMTTLLQEFEKWLKEEYDLGFPEYNDGLAAALEKLEELKKKHNVV